MSGVSQDPKFPKSAIRNPPSEIRHPLRGTAPGAGYVREMFARIAPRYDFLNHLLSMQADRWWRRRVARRFRHILERPGAQVLDLCCGTADLALRLAGVAHPSARILGADFCHPMLERAQEKLRRRGLPPLVAEADALVLPFADGAFDLVTTAFGFRNLADYGAGLREVFRVLAPGGEAGILEFSEPTSPIFSRLYKLYFRRVLPRIGGAVSGDAGAYQYLARSVTDFPSPEGLASWMTEVGFAGVSFQKFTGGIACLHAGQRPTGGAGAQETRLS